KCEQEKVDVFESLHNRSISFELGTCVKRTDYWLVNWPRLFFGATTFPTDDQKPLVVVKLPPLIVDAAGDCPIVPSNTKLLLADVPPPPATTYGSIGPGEFSLAAFTTGPSLVFWIACCGGLCCSIAGFSCVSNVAGIVRARIKKNRDIFSKSLNMTSCPQTAN